jgi:hypothetical protein
MFPVAHCSVAQPAAALPSLVPLAVPEASPDSLPVPVLVSVPEVSSAPLLPPPLQAAIEQAETRASNHLALDVWAGTKLCRYRTFTKLPAFWSYKDLI